MIKGFFKLRRKYVYSNYNIIDIRLYIFVVHISGHPVDVQLQDINNCINRNTSKDAFVK